VPSVNRQITLAGQPEGLPKESDFRLVESPMPKAGAGEVLVRVLYLSVDPQVRPRITGRPSSRYPTPGEVMAGEVVGQVVESNDPRIALNDFVEGTLGWQEYATAHAKSLRKIDPEAAPIAAALHVLGMPGLTAYFGLLDICRPQPGETVVVSAASGAVGSTVGQIARIKRCRAVGITGSDEKARFLTQELGFDAAFNYQGVTDHQVRLKQVCPNGIDVYFDNVGGPITDEVIRSINTRARIAVCAQRSRYSTEQQASGPRWLDQLIVKQARIEGFQVTQFSSRWEEGLRQMTTWLHQKKIRYRDDVVEGIENAPKAFIGILTGETVGKSLVKIATSPLAMVA
jgi:NADPH:quinone reductase